MILWSSMLIYLHRSQGESITTGTSWDQEFTLTTVNFGSSLRVSLILDYAHEILQNLLIFAFLFT